MADTLLLIIVAIILIETSALLFRRVPSKNSRGDIRVAGSQRSILVDTSVLIDGRILDIAQAGFIPGKLVIPRSVLGELQLLADGSDHEKRNRARNGMEVITKLQEIPSAGVEIHPDESDAREGVDNRLLALARQLHYELCTVDYNLQKVAQAEGITILSINELSQKLRALYLPGEKLELTLKQKGQEKGQAIGYASDGTMVVVDNADKLMNQTVAVEIIRSLQTNSGKMMFAKLVTAAPQGRSGRESSRSDSPKPANPRTGSRIAARFVKPQSSRTSRAATQAEPVLTLTEASTDTRREQTEEPRPERRVIGRTRRPSSKQSPEDDLLALVNKQ